LYVKIFEQIFDSSVSEDYQTRLVFTDLLVLADEEGIVDMTVEAIARRTNVPLEIVRTGIQKLEQVDPQSRSKDEGGRRLIRLDDHRDWGWRIVNYEKYRMLRTKEDRKQYHRDYYRSNRSKEAKASQQDSTALNNSQQTQPSAYASASASELRNTENQEEKAVDAMDVPFAAEPEPGYRLEPPKRPLSADEQSIKATAKHLFETHEKYQGTMDSTLRALRTAIRREDERPLAPLLEHIRKQHARWMKSSQWKCGKVNGLSGWLEDGLWKNDPPRDFAPECRTRPIVEPDYGPYRELLPDGTCAPVQRRPSRNIAG
jgi:hypothetical protein